MTAHVTTLQAASMEGRYRLLVDAITDYIIYMLDTEGRVSSWNAGALRFKGYIEQEILGEHFSRFYTPEDLAAGIPARSLSTAEFEGRFEAEGWRVRKDGERFGRMSSSTRSAISTANCSGLPRSPATFQRERLPKRS